MKQIVRIKFGSHLYGTNTPTSDVDYKAVHIPSRRDILLQRVQGSIGKDQRTKAEGEKNQPGDVDDESYSVQRYLELLSKGETVAIDMLFAPFPEILEYEWGVLRANAHRLVTKRSSAFVGYCREQANKYGIKGSRVAEVRAVVDFFASALEERGATAKVESVVGLMPTGEHTKLADQTRPDGVQEYFVECCNRKINYTATVKHAHEVYSKVLTNYGDRAKKAEANEGVDWKALSHAVRVGHEALELLRTGRVIFPLVDREEVMAIKLGQWEYKRVAARIEQLMADVETASEVSTLPDKPDQEWVDGFVEMVHEEAVRRRLK